MPEIIQDEWISGNPHIEEEEPIGIQHAGAARDASVGASEARGGQVGAGIPRYLCACTGAHAPSATALQGCILALNTGGMMVRGLRPPLLGSRSLHGAALLLLLLLLLLLRSCTIACDGLVPGQHA